VRFLILSGALAVASPALAQDVDCDNAITQSDMTQCAQMFYEAADAELNAVWKDAMAAMKEIDSYQGEGDEGAADALLQSQRAWITYRDNYCTAAAYHLHGGSAEPMEYAGCLATVTQNRTAELRGMAEGF
jgi:uncharacterized protein YecT (DUF1311 family)